MAKSSNHKGCNIQYSFRKVYIACTSVEWLPPITGLRKKLPELSYSIPLGKTFVVSADEGTKTQKVWVMPYTICFWRSVMGYVVYHTLLEVCDGWKAANCFTNILCKRLPPKAHVEVVDLCKEVIVNAEEAPFKVFSTRTSVSRFKPGSLEKYRHSIMWLTII